MVTLLIMIISIIQKNHPHLTNDDDDDDYDHQPGSPDPEADGQAA